MARFALLLLAIIGTRVSSQPNARSKFQKIPLAGNMLSGYVSIAILIKCGVWVVYAERVMSVPSLRTESIDSMIGVL